MQPWRDPGEDGFGKKSRHLRFPLSRQRTAMDRAGGGDMDIAWPDFREVTPRKRGA
jgi:hypothetical protein